MSDKLAEIESLANSNANNIKRLLELSQDTDEEVRFRAIEAFESFTKTPLLLDRVRAGLSDDDELVRSTCAELIGVWQDSNSIETLFQLVSDEDELVRSAAITSLGKMARKDAVWFLEGKYKELQSLERLSASIALYTLGREEYLKEAISFLGNGDYRVRCAAANLLADFTDEDDISLVVTSLKEALLKEDTKAAASSISSAISELE